MIRLFHLHFIADEEEEHEMNELQKQFIDGVDDNDLNMLYKKNGQKDILSLNYIK